MPKYLVELSLEVFGRVLLSPELRPLLKYFATSSCPLISKSEAQQLFTLRLRALFGSFDSQKRFVCRPKDGTDKGHVAEGLFKS